MGCACSKNRDKSLHVDDVVLSTGPTYRVSKKAAAKKTAWEAKARRTAARKAREVQKVARRDAALSDRGCTINETAYRALTLRQLREVAWQIKQRCEAEKWEGDVRQPDGSFRRQRLTPMDINLYHLNELFIKPMTLARRCSYVELVASGPQKPAWFCRRDAPRALG